MALSLRLPHQHPVHISILSHTRHMPCPSHSSRFTTRTILGKEYRSFSSSLCSFHHSPVTSSLLSPNTILNTLFSNILSLCYSLNVSDQVSHPYKTTRKIIVLYMKCDGTRAETRFHLSAKRTSPFKSAGASIQSTTSSRGVRISGSNAGRTMFRGSVKSTGYPLHSPVSPSLPLPASTCATTFQVDSTTDTLLSYFCNLCRTLDSLPTARFTPCPSYCQYLLPNLLSTM